MSNISTEDTIVKMGSVEEEEWIRAIKSLLFRNSEEGLIPEVTVSDNGKVLTVVRGAWDKAEAPSGGGGEAGYTYSVEETFLFNETFEPGREQGAPYLQAQLNYSDSITADLLKVEFDGVEYICPLENVQDGQRYTYGGYTFEKYPFVIVSNQSVHQNWVYTPTSGEHSIEVSRCEESVSTTRSFEKAVKSAADDGVEIVDIVQTGTGASQSTPIINFSYDDVGQIMQKYNNGKAFVRLQLLDNPSLNYYTNGAHLYVDTFYADWSSMTGDYYLLHACGTSTYNVSGNNIRVYDIKLEVGRSSNRLTIRAIQISPEQL